MVFSTPEIRVGHNKQVSIPAYMGGWSRPAVDRIVIHVLGFILCELDFWQPSVPEVSPTLHADTQKPHLCVWWGSYLVSLKALGMRLVVTEHIQEPSDGHLSVTGPHTLSPHAMQAIDEL